MAWIAVSCGRPPRFEGEWPTYGHDAGGQRFSQLNLINRSNVKSLKVAWEYRTGDAYQPSGGRKPPAFEATPVYVDGTLYISTPLGTVVALDPVTGRKFWAYRTDVHKDAGFGDFANRGVSVWKSDSGRRRIFLATIDGQLIALNSLGEPCGTFGKNGVVNLRAGLRIPPRDDAAYYETSPPAVIGDTVVVGSGIADNGATDQPSGEVRGFDVITGKLKWSWDPIPQDSGAPGADTWKNGSACRTGAANAWSIISADPARNLIFVPTGSASPDHYGGERLGDNLFANSVVALRADNGRPVWYFQTVHHDLWDYDVATSPLLFDMHRNGESIPAVAVGSKTGNLFLLNRETGRPIFGVEERPAPKSDVPGEVTAATQPFPLRPAPVSPEKVKADDAFGIDDTERAWCRAELEGLRNDGIFTPPSLGGSLIFPSPLGGMNWGGMAYDPVHDLLVLPANRIGLEVRLVPRIQSEGARNSINRNVNGDWEFATQRGTPYGMFRRFLLSPKKIPCTAPPWSTLTAITASTGQKKWEVPLGRWRADLPEKWGSLSLGGPIATAGGVIFVAGTLDAAIYAFDVETGQLLWEGKLPTAARATPMTYLGADGKQYLVICAGGIWPMAGPVGDYVVAFAL